MKLKRYMTKLKTLLIKYPSLILLVLYVLIHLVLINVNVAEWGDSYRILRAALYIDNLTYPDDEKRPPLFSALISVFPQNPDPVLWGRVTVFALGVATFGLFLKLLKKFLLDHTVYSVRNLYLGGLLFMFNPVLFYWSLRVMSDVLFLFLVVLAFCIYYFVHHPAKKAALLGLVAGFSVLTRFEGYLLFGAFGLEFGISFLQKKDFKSIFMYGLAFMLLFIPFVVWRNPLSSSYLEEPGGRVYDINTVFIFLLAFLFSLGFTSAPQFFRLPKKFVQTNIALTAFLSVSFILVLLWPAAVPRLLMPMLPFLIIFVVLNMVSYFSQAKSTKDIRGAIVGLSLLALYVVGQLKYKQQFMIVNKYIFVLIVLLSILSIFFMFIRNARLFYASIVLSALLWSSSIIYLHKDLYTTLIITSDYMLQNLQGHIKYNDTASIIEWTIDHRDPQNKLTGDFGPLYNTNTIDYNKLIGEKKYDYLVVTTEERPSLNFEPDANYLVEVFSSEKYTNGAVFSTKIYKVNYE